MVEEFELEQDDRKRVIAKPLRVLSKEQVVCTNSAETASFFRKSMHDDKFATEHVFVLSFTAASELIAVTKVASGSVNAALLSTRTIFQVALLTNATFIVIVHNHPSGACVPSEQDRGLTEKVIAAGLLLEVPVIEHIVMGKEKYIGIRENLGGEIRKGV